MKRIITLPSFEKSAKKLEHVEKTQLSEALAKFSAFVYRGIAPSGLGFKKIGQDIYEFRVGLKLRIIVTMEQDTYYLVLIGSHNDISRYLSR